MSIHSSRDKLLLKTMIKLTEIESRPHNIGFAIWRVKCYYETFVQDSTSVILLNFCAKMPPHRKAVNRYIELDKLLWCSTGFSASMGIVFFLAAQAGFQVLAVRPCK